MMNRKKIDSILVKKTRSIYGYDLIYPVCKNAKLLAKIAGTSTIQTDAIKHIKELGIQIEIEPPELPKL